MGHARAQSQEVDALQTYRVYSEYSGTEAAGGGAPGRTAWIAPESRRGHVLGVRGSHFTLRCTPACRSFSARPWSWVFSSLQQRRPATPRRAPSRTIISHIKIRRASRRTGRTRPAPAICHVARSTVTRTTAGARLGAAHRASGAHLSGHLLDAATSRRIERTLPPVSIPTTAASAHLATTAILRKSALTVGPQLVARPEYQQISKLHSCLFINDSGAAGQCTSSPAAEMQCQVYRTLADDEDQRTSCATDR